MFSCNIYLILGLLTLNQSFFYIYTTMLNDASYFISQSATAPAVASVVRFRSVRLRP